MSRYAIIGLLCAAACSSGEKHTEDRVVASVPASWRLLAGPEGVSHTIRGELVQLRVGLHSESAEFRGCALYFPGFSDSIANQKPLFEILAANGYRTIAFDYPGQGGSTGSMNDTRLEAPERNADQRIERMGETVWQTMSRNFEGAPCRARPDLVVGWSTGGLEAYRWATQGRIPRVLLFAPGLRVHAFIGELAKKPTRLVTFKPVMTIESLTNAPESERPHVDMPKPNHPLKAPAFVTNLITSGLIAGKKAVPASVAGLAFFAGQDTYVQAEDSMEILREKAPHFQIHHYPDAKHEIANEKASIRADVAERIKAFLAN